MAVTHSYRVHQLVQLSQYPAAALWRILALNGSLAELQSIHSTHRKTVTIDKLYPRKGA